MDNGNGLGSEILAMFDLPDEIETIITHNNDSGPITAIAHETLARLSDTGKLKVALAKIAYSLERAGDKRNAMESRLDTHVEQCRKIQSGETPYGCAHLENLKGALDKMIASLWKVLAISFCLPIVIAVVITALMWASKQ